MTFYPVNLNIKNKLCVVIGGGEVASRKIAPLLYCGARVRIISPVITESLQKIVDSGQVVWDPRNYQPGDLQEAFLVFAVTNNRAVQEAIASEAQEEGVLLNSADDPTGCSFQVPAKVRRGDFLLTISTGGGSPALSAKIRKELEEAYGAEYGLYISLLARIREKIVTDGDSSEKHKILFERLMNLDLLTYIKERNWAGLQQTLCAALPEYVDAGNLVKSVQNS